MMEHLNEGAILSALSGVSSANERVKKLLVGSTLHLSKDIEAVLEHYDTMIGKQQGMIISLLQNCRSATDLYNQTKHQLNIELMLKQGRLNEN